MTGDTTPISDEARALRDEMNGRWLDAWTAAAGEDEAAWAERMGLAASLPEGSPLLPLALAVLYPNPAAPLLVSAEAERLDIDVPAVAATLTALTATVEGLRAELAEAQRKAGEPRPSDVARCEWVDLTGRCRDWAGHDGEHTYPAALRAAGGQEKLPCDCIVDCGHCVPRPAPVGGPENDEPKFTVGPDGSVYAAQAGLTLAELGDPSKVAQHVARRVGIQLPAPVGGQAKPSDAQIELRSAVRGVSAALVAHSHLLLTPFTDAPDLTPWSLYFVPAMARLRDVVTAVISGGER